MDITELLSVAVKNKASDLHLSAGLAPMIRVEGDLCPISIPILEHQDIKKLLYSLMNERQQQEYEAHLEIDFSFTHHLGRCRINMFHQCRGAAAVCRIIPSNILTMNDLKLPPIFTEITNYPHGLVLVTGPTGSGKSTTLAALIDFINTTRCAHILTIEDPIEFIHKSKKSLISQRQVHHDTLSFAHALRSALREDPDVILVGELRDLETIRLAMTAAETGHLVLASLHTNSATKAINRMVDVFPAEEKSMARSLLSESLQAVIAQRLLKKKSGGRIAAWEIMIGTHAIRHLIREDKIAQMYSCLQTGHAKGMNTLDQHLIELVQKNLITSSTAYAVAMDKTLF